MLPANDTEFLGFLTLNRDNALADRQAGREIPAGPNSPATTPEAWQYAIELVRAWGDERAIPRSAYEGVKLPYGIAVHVSHCCLTHGCKYGKSVCAVAKGYFLQDHPCEACDSALEDGADALDVIRDRLRTRMGDTDTTIPLHERVRAIANMDHPWIPGAQADLIREIADELETLQKIRSIING